MHRSSLARSLASRVLSFALATSVVSGVACALPAAAAAAYPTFAFSGRGNGHGIGLSQWGAKGYADRGWGGEQIAAYYYPGTTVITASEKTILVNVDPAANYASGGNAGYTNATWKLRPGYLGAQMSVNGSLTLDDAAAPYSFTGSGDTIVVKDKNGALVAGPLASPVTVTPVGGAPGLTMVDDGTGYYDRAYVRYRGTMVLSSKSSKVKLLNRVSMSEYLYGVVPRESISTWNAEALKAQAIVARSYATAGAPSELYCDTRSQVYCGHSHGSRSAPTYDETVATNSAVDSTAGRFVAYNGTIIRTYFGDSSGGYTANIEDVWKGSAALPYYRGVPDPYCVSPGNDPWSSASVFDGKAIADKIGRPSGASSSVYVVALSFNRGVSEHVKSVDVTWSNGATTNVWGDTFRSKLGLRSTKFYVGAPTGRIAYGDRYTTAVAVSQSSFPAGSSPKAIVVANGTDTKFPDALTASGLAGVAGGPVLMTRGTSLDPTTLSEVKRLKSLGASKVYVVGGPASVSAGVVSQLGQVMQAANSVERLAGNARYGTNRYGTAASVAMKMKELGADGSKVLIASGEKWTDAAVASSVSAASGRPVVLVASNSLPGGSQLVLGDLGARETAVFGGPATIGNGALAPVLGVTGEKAPTRRFGTSGTRYDVAVAAAQWCVGSFGYSLDSAYISTGEKFPDSVTGGVLSAKAKRPLLLTATGSASPATVNYLSANRATVKSLTIIGGTASVSAKAAQALAIAAD